MSVEKFKKGEKKRKIQKEKKRGKRKEVEGGCVAIYYPANFSFMYSSLWCSK
jgi:hypothetical protein